MVSHGASRMLKERLFDMSDPYEISVCDKCGMILKSASECTICKTDNVSNVNIPYAAKLLTNLLNAMLLKTVIRAE